LGLAAHLVEGAHARLEHEVEISREVGLVRVRVRVRARVGVRVRVRVRARAGVRVRVRVSG